MPLHWPSFDHFTYTTVLLFNQLKVNYLNKIITLNTGKTKSVWLMNSTTLMKIINVEISLSKCFKSFKIIHTRTYIHSKESHMYANHGKSTKRETKDMNSVFHA